MFVKRFCYYILILFLPSALSSSEKANQIFRDSYRQEKEKSLESLGPIIISKGNDLILYYKGSREEVHYIPDLYHKLKEIDHVPLALIFSSQELESKIVQLLENLTFPSHLMQNQKSILNRCLTFIREKEELLPFCRDIAPYLLINAEEAAFLQLDALHSQTQKWKKKIPREDWNRLAVIVIGPQMPRVGEVSLQYFARLTGNPLSESQLLPSRLSFGKADEESLKPSKKNRRLVYAENLWDEQKALDLLATHIVDEKIGYLFFNDKQRMFYDLLSESASKRLAEKCDCH